MAALTINAGPATELQLALGLVIVFVVTTVTVVVGCWCGRKRKKQYEVEIPEKGIYENDGSGKQRRISILDERKYSEANDYSEQKRKALESLLEKRSNAADSQISPPTTTAQSSTLQTDDGYSMLGPDGNIITDKITEEDMNENREYDEVNDDDPVEPENAQTPEIGREYEISDDKPYYTIPYWEPANKEEELMSQLYSTLKLQRIPAETVELKEELGSGQFGTVYRGLWRKETESGGEDDSDEATVMEVAVKSLGKEASEEERVTFLREAAIMGQFNHPYLVKLLGIIDDEPVRLVEELMPKGDLRRHLSSLKPKEGDSNYKELAGLLLSHSRQIALGMLCLQMKQFIHRDLAARNVLVTEDGLCKIADFGLSRNLQNEDYYMSHGGKIPVKWTAPEALHYRKYSTASDVWSYGCLLYEIWSLGHKPFHDLTNAQVIEKVGTGYRLPPPPGCPRYIYQIMMKCWNPEASSRPSFCAIIIALQHPDFEILKWSDKDKAAYSEKAMTLGSPIKEGASLFKDLQRTYLNKPVV